MSGQWLRAGWERTSLYLPVILMGLLALGTYWLVKSAPVRLPDQTPAAARHEADYFMRQFSVKTFDAAGKLKSEVNGRNANHYPDTRTLEIEAIQMRSFDTAGRLTTASAQHALTNADASEVQLLGQARVLRQPVLGAAGSSESPLEFSGEFLHAFVSAQRLESNQPVQLRRGTDQFSADHMRFDNHSGVLELTGHVKVSLLPSKTRIP